MARNDYGVTFNGRRIVHPGAYDFIDASAMTVTTLGSTNLPIVIGTADSGKSGEVQWFTSPEEAKSYLSGGDLVTALELMFSPIPEGGGGASLVGVIVANETTQATLTIGGIEHTAISYGEGGNRIQTKLESGTISGTKKFTAFRWDTETLETFDNLGAVISIKYVGTQQYASMSVTSNRLTIDIGADAATAITDVDIDLTDPRFGTVELLVNYLSSMEGYEVSYGDYNSAELPSSALDEVLDVNIKDVKGYVLAVKAEIESVVNKYSTLVDIQIPDGNALADFPFTYLQGGSKGTVPSSWEPYFETVKKQFSDILVLLTSDSTIHAEALAHVHQMETRNQKQMLFTGGSVGETVDQVKLRAIKLNSSRAVLAYPGIYSRNYQDGKGLLAPYFTAALIAGRIAGVDASEPITFDYVNAIGLEYELIEGDPNIDELITSGICTLEKVQNGGIRIAQGVTTYLGVNNILYREISVRRGADKVSENMRKAMEKTFVGKKGLKTTASAVTTVAIDVLEQAIKDGDIVAYSNIVVRFVNTVVYVDYNISPTEPINFVLVTSHFVPAEL